MGVDYDATCFLGWEVSIPDGEEPEDYMVKLADKTNWCWGRSGDGSYGGEDTHYLGIPLKNGLRLECLMDAIDKIKDCYYNGSLPELFIGVLIY
jgi:hypothetical protein